MAKCEACGGNIGFSIIKFVVPDMNGKEHRICKQCHETAIRVGKYLKYDPKKGAVIMVSKDNAEIMKKCMSCGHVMCFTAMDMYNNKQAAKSAVWDALAGTANALNGRFAASAVNTSNANNQLNQIQDYNKCPNCGSIDLVEITKEEWNREKRSSSLSISPADEIKKYKELLDSGIITQEEFDTKKSELLR